MSLGIEVSSGSKGDLVSKEKKGGRGLSEREEGKKEKEGRERKKKEGKKSKKEKMHSSVLRIMFGLQLKIYGCGGACQKNLLKEVQAGGQPGLHTFW